MTQQIRLNTTTTTHETSSS